MQQLDTGQHMNSLHIWESSGGSARPMSGAASSRSCVAPAVAQQQRENARTHAHLRSTNSVISLRCLPIECITGSVSCLVTGVDKCLDRTYNRDCWRTEPGFEPTIFQIPLVSVTTTPHHPESLLWNHNQSQTQRWRSGLREVYQVIKTLIPQEDHVPFCARELLAPRSTMKTIRMKTAAPPVPLPTITDASIPAACSPNA